MTVLGAAIGAGDSFLAVNAAPPGGGPFLAQIDGEQILVLDGSATVWGPCQRGQNGTQATSHAQGATVTPLYRLTSSAVPGAPPLSGSSAVVTVEGTFQAAGAGTYTFTCAIPAGATVLDVIFRNTAVWDNATSASMTCGDDDAATGYFTATNVKSAPAADTNGAGAGLSTQLSLGASAGAYKGGAGKFCATAKTITCAIVAVGAGVAGQSRVLVKYAVPITSAAVKS